MKIFVDGGYHPKYKQSAYAYTYQYPNKPPYSTCGFSNATNSREAELLAAELALRNTDEKYIELYTDYQGLIDGIEAKKHTKEFQGIIEAMGNKTIKMFHMNGHRDDNNVIECDKMINKLWNELRRLEKQKN